MVKRTTYKSPGAKLHTVRDKKGRFVDIHTYKRAHGQQGSMGMMKYVYYQDGKYWIGWLEEYPDYRTQGLTEVELQDNLRDIYSELTSGSIPAVRRVGELAIK